MAVRCPLLALVLLVLAAPAVRADAVVVDGTVDAAYGAARSLQTTQTDPRPTPTSGCPARRTGPSWTAPTR